MGSQRHIDSTAFDSPAAPSPPTVVLADGVSCAQCPDGEASRRSTKQRRTRTPNEVRGRQRNPQSFDTGSDPHARGDEPMRDPHRAAGLFALPTPVGMNRMVPPVTPASVRRSPRPWGWTDVIALLPASRRSVSQFHVDEPVRAHWSDVTDSVLPTLVGIL